MQVQFHRAAFCAPDGTVVLWHMYPWQGSTDLPAPYTCSTSEYPVLYYVPMDDQPDHWHRLVAEAQSGGAPGVLRHTGGVAHPQHTHVRLGGMFSWATPPRPAVAAAARRLGAEDDDALIARWTGGRLG